MVSTIWHFVIFCFFFLSLLRHRYSLLVISSSPSDTSIFDIRYFIFLSPSGHFTSIFDIRYSIFDIQSFIFLSPSDIRYSFDIRYSIFDIQSFIFLSPSGHFDIRYSIFVIRYSLFVIQSFYFCQHLRIIIEKIIQCGSSHLKNPGSFGFVATSLG